MWEPAGNPWGRSMTMLNSSVSPEEFAASYTKELGLSGEFA
jgi:hypothetical protein